MKPTKAEIDTELKEEIKLVKEYLSQCPTVSGTSDAIRISMAALDQELNRIERDAKLRRKFNQQQHQQPEVRYSRGSAVHVASGSLSDDDDDMVRVEAPVGLGGAAILKDWQQVKVDATQNDGQDCYDDIGNVNDEIKAQFFVFIGHIR